MPSDVGMDFAVLKRSIAQTLFLVITVLAIVLVLAMSGLFRVSLQHGFRTYVQSLELQRLATLEKPLLARYEAEGGWSFLQGFNDLGRALQQSASVPPQEGGLPPPGPGEWQPGWPPPPPFGMAGGPGPGFGPPGPGFGPPPPPPGAPQFAEVNSQDLEGPRPPPREEAAGGWPGPRDRPPPGRDVLSLGSRVALLDAQGRFVAGNAQALREPRRALYLGEGAARRLVGYLVLTEPPAAQRQAGEDFVASQFRNLLWISLLVLVLSAVAAGGLAAYFRRPVRALAEGTRRVASGDFATRLPEGRPDELGRMATDFNRMAEKLEAFEVSRRQWMADSSHELRTPLTVLAAQLEGMRDGVLPNNPEKLQSLSRTVDDMSRLVNDLFLLATADAGGHDYRYESVPVAGLLAELGEGFAPRLAAAKLDFEVDDRTPSGTCLRADRLRIAQVLGNLLTNSSRYTDAGGRVRVMALRRADGVDIMVEDSAPGVPAAALPRLFERFYRVDASRSRKSGGAGLGLAICRAIVQAHGGSIAASVSVLGGLKVVVSLPQAQG